MTGPSGVVTFLFTDLVSSTEILSRLGDESAEELRRVHFGLLREAVTESGGHEVKNLGDGLMVAFPSVLAALQCAVSMQQLVDLNNRGGGGARLDVRIGINVGEPIMDEEDYFGAAVVIAKRLCDKAEGGQILASDLVRRLIGSRRDVHFEDAGPLQLKGIAEPVDAVSVLWEAREQIERADEASEPFFTSGILPSGYGRFVGRERELEALTDHLDSVARGEGKLVLLAGEPGVGKTRLASEAARMASARGWPVLFGRCYESEGMPSYIAFIEALSEYFRGTGPELTKRLTGSAGPDLALLIPPLREQFPDVHARGSSLGDDDRYHLFQSVTDVLFNIGGLSAEGGVFLLLDDLQWADRSSLLLLQHLARRLARSRVLVVGTYRTVDLDRVHPLSEFLAVLSRERLYQRFPISSLSEAETAALIESVCGLQPESQVVEAVYRDTGGNAFFVEEVVRHLKEQGRDLSQPSTAIEEWGIPEGVKQVIGRRLTHLSDEANRLLQAASIAGPSFDLETVQIASGLHPDAATEAIEEALRSGLVREQNGYSFAHAVVHETVQDELSLTRRQRLHLHLAEAIETVHSGNLKPQFAALAVHYRESGAAAPAEKALKYSEAAALEANRVYAFQESFNHYLGALRAFEAIGVDDLEHRFDLLYSLLVTKAGVSGPLEAIQEFGEEAFHIAVKLGDAERISRICITGPRILRSGGGPGMANTPLFKTWVERADRHAGDGTLARIYADVERAFVLIDAGRFAEAFKLRRKTVALARKLGNADALLFAVRYHLMHAWPVDAMDERYDLAIEFAGWPEGATAPGDGGRWEEDWDLQTPATSPGGLSLAFLSHVLRECARAVLERGDRVQAEALAQRAGSLARESRDPIALLNQERLEIMFATLDGNLEGATVLANRFRVHADEYGSRVYGRAAVNGALTYLGRFEEALAEVDKVVEFVQSLGGKGTAELGDLVRAVLLAHLGRSGEARLLLDAFTARTDISRNASCPDIVLAWVMEAALALGDLKTASVAAESLEGGAWLPGPVTANAKSATVPCIARLLGDAAYARDERVEAKNYYEQAVTVVKGSDSGPNWPWRVCS